MAGLTLQNGESNGNAQSKKSGRRGPDGQHDTNRKKGERF